MDESEDGEFYGQARLVTHIDDAAIGTSAQPPPGLVGFLEGKSSVFFVDDLGVASFFRKTKPPIDWGLNQGCGYFYQK